MTGVLSGTEGAVTFLHALGRLLESGAPGESEAGGEESIDEIHAALQSLLRHNAFPTFTFRLGEVEYEGEILEELRSWPWCSRLPAAGVERLEITPGTTREDMQGFAQEVVSRLYLSDDGAALMELRGQSGIRYARTAASHPDSTEAVAPPPLAVGLEEEAKTLEWLNGEVLDHGVVPADESAAVVRLLSVAMHSEREVVIPLVELKSVDQYTTSHSMNVSCLSMALAEYLQYSRTDVCAIGEAALLHDVGKTRIPLEVLNKTGKLTPSEWALMQTHTVEGARILLASSGHMELAAVVAYEHHLSWKGDGYPELSVPRQPHPVSRLVQVCDVFDALRTRRPFRPPWPHDRAVEYLRSKAADTLDPEYVDAFLSMIRQWEPRQVALDAEEPDKEPSSAVTLPV